MSGDKDKKAMVNAIAYFVGDHKLLGRAALSGPVFYFTIVTILLVGRG
jgi:hypothetical protein